MGINQNPKHLNKDKTTIIREGKNINLAEPLPLCVSDAKGELWTISTNDGKIVIAEYRKDEEKIEYLLNEIAGASRVHTAVMTNEKIYYVYGINANKETKGFKCTGEQLHAGIFDAQQKKHISAMKLTDEYGKAEFLMKSIADANNNRLNYSYLHKAGLAESPYLEIYSIVMDEAESKLWISSNARLFAYNMQSTILGKLEGLFEINETEGNGKRVQNIRFTESGHGNCREKPDFIVLLIFA